MRRRAVHLHLGRRRRRRPRGHQWPLGSGKTMSFTFQERRGQERPRHRHGRRRRHRQHHEGRSRSARPPRRPTRRRRTRRSARARPARPPTTRRRSRSLERERIDVRVPARLGGVGELHEPLDDRALADGPHSVSVRATDAAGNIDATPADAGVHGRHDARVGQHARPTPRSVRARPVPPTTPPRRSPSPRARAARRSQCQRRHRLVGDLHQPVDDDRAGQRRPQRGGPRDRRGREHRRLAGDALVHASTRRPRTRRSTRRRPPCRPARARRVTFSAERVRRDVRVPARRRGVGRVHVAEDLHRPRAGPAHGRRPRDRRGGQRRRARRRAPAGRRSPLPGGGSGGGSGRRPIRFRRIGFRFGHGGADGDALRPAAGCDVHLDA